MDPTFADFVVLAILGASVLFSFFFGFVWEVLFFGSWIGAGIAAYMGFPYVSPYVQEQLGYGLASDVVSALGVFIAALVVLMILTQMISSRVRRNGAISLADRALGVGFGLARGGLVVIALWLMIDYAAPNDPPKTVRNSISLPYVKEATRIVMEAIPEAIRARARATADDGRDKADATRDLLDATGRLRGGDGGADEGYNRETSRQLERLIDSTNQDR